MATSAFFTEAKRSSTLGETFSLRDRVVGLELHEGPEVLRGLVAEADAEVGPAPMLVGVDQQVAARARAGPRSRAAGSRGARWPRRRGRWSGSAAAPRTPRWRGRAGPGCPGARARSRRPGAGRLGRGRGLGGRGRGGADGRGRGPARAMRGQRRIVLIGSAALSARARRRRGPPRTGRGSRARGFLISSAGEGGQELARGVEDEDPALLVGHVGVAEGVDRRVHRLLEPARAHRPQEPPGLVVGAHRRLLAVEAHDGALAVQEHAGDLAVLHVLRRREGVPVLEGGVEPVDAVLLPVRHEVAAERGPHRRA